MDRRSSLPLFVCSLYLLMNVLAVGFCAAKYRALGFHTRDFPYYLQLYTKLFDKTLSPRLSLNPQGDNFLQMRGVEGVKSIHQALHFEPFKYFYAGLYRIFESPLALFAFTSVVFFSPILYLLVVFPVRSRRDRYFVALFSLAYCLYPSVLYAVSYDLRPYTLLAPLFVLSFLSIHFRRPSLEVVVFFNAMFLAREEALVLGLAILLYSVVCNYEERAGRWWRVIALAASWGLWATLITTYYTWTGYESKLGRKLYGFLADPAGVAIISLVVVASIYVYGRLRPIIARNLKVSAFSVVFLPLGAQLLSLQSVQVLFHPRWILLIYSFLILSVIVWQTAKGSRKRGVVLYLLGTIAALSLVLNFATPKSVFAEFRSYVSDRRHAEVVWSQREMTDRYHTSILTDFSSYQAFYDYERVYVYERLPWDATKHPVRWRRYYPLNLDLLVGLFEQDLLLIVFSRKEESKIRRIVEEANLLDRLEPVSGNEKYSVLRIKR